MLTEGSLKRLGGGRWETRDGRFTIEPQSGTWVVVDHQETDDLGLPLVRGPFASLSAAKGAIEGARDGGPLTSPLAERLEQARTSMKAVAAPAAVATRAAVAAPASRRRGAAADRSAEGASSPPSAASATPAPPTPTEPKWLREMAPADRRRARELIGRLDDLDVADPEGVARAEIARDQPAVARAALERAIRQAIASASDAASAGRAVADAILRGRDKALGVRWQVVDERGRRIDELDLSD